LTNTTTIFLWDEDAKKIAGAYRMGLGSEIYPKYGIEGFYLNELFRFEPELHDMMHKSRWVVRYISNCAKKTNAF
jgi:hypothetical protein